MREDRSENVDLSAGASSWPRKGEGLAVGDRDGQKGRIK